MQRQFTGGTGCQARNLDVMSKKMIYESGSVRIWTQRPNRWRKRALRERPPRPRVFGDPTCFLFSAKMNPGEELSPGCCTAGENKGRPAQKHTYGCIKMPFFSFWNPPLLTFSPFISFSQPPVTSPAQLLGPNQSPLVCGASRVENGCCKRAHFREPSAFEGA